MNRRLLLALVLTTACGGTPAPTAASPPAPTLAPAASAPSAAAAAPDARPPAFRLPRTVRPLRYALDFTLVPSAPSFAGVADIDLELAEPTQIIWLHAVGLTIQDAQLAVAGSTLRASVVPGDAQLMGFQVDRPVGPGTAHLRIAYRGGVSLQDFVGFFREKEGDEWFLFSQGEAIGARRMFPGFDEPAFKVPFRITVHARREHGVFSNSPLVAETDEPEGMKAVVFAETPPMPSYGLAIAVGPFQVVDVADRPTRIRLVVPPGHERELGFAREHTPGLLARLERYFGTPYPYAKLDLVVVPFFLGAMENPGLITFKVPYLLGAPEQMTGERQRTIANVIIHELAHMWFGNLVTMAWWDDVWLNESLTSWITDKLLAEWKPEWRTDVDEVKDRNTALGQDAMTTVARLRQPVENQGDLERNGNGLIYSKGASMVRMFEGWIGSETLQKGVRLYLDRHRWGNATAGDFLAALGEAAGRDLATPYGTFLDQEGAPLVSLELACEKGRAPRLELTQERVVPTGVQGAAARSWQVPVCVRWGLGKLEGGACTLLAGARAELVLEDARGCPDWVVPNAGARGYYRAWPRGGLLGKLLRAPAGQLSGSERVGLVGDLGALVESGHVPVAEALDALAALARDDDAAVVAASLGFLADVDRRLLPDELRRSYARFLQKHYGARARALGWTARAGESDELRALRPLLVQLVATEGGDRKLAAEGARLARLWLDDRKAVDAQVADAAIAVAVAQGDVALFDRIHAAARAAVGNEDRRTLLGALGRFTDPVLVERALAIVLGDEFLAIDTRAILGSLSADRRTRRVAYEWVKSHFDVLVQKLPEVARPYVVRYGDGFCDEAHAADVHSFFGAREQRFPAGDVALAEALEKIRVCHAYRGAQAASLASFLKRF